MQMEIILNTVCFCGFFLLLYRNRYNDLRLINSKGELTDKSIQRVRFHIICIAWLLAFIPLIKQFRTLHLINSVEVPLASTLILAAAFVVTMIIVFFSATQNSVNVSQSWRTIANSVLVSYLVVRLLFLFAYEIFMRGSVLPVLIDATGTWIAILFNTILYGILHAFASRKEIIGSLLFGPILCFVTIQFQALWPAITLHLMLAVAYEGIQLSHHFKSLKQPI